MPTLTTVPEAARTTLPKLVPSCGIQSALQIAQSILEKESQLFKLGGRHSGIIHAHSELWCAVHLGLDLPFTGVSAGADAWAKCDSVIPLKTDDTVQIKARGSEETMHTTFKTQHKHQHLNWLVVMIYQLASHDMTPKCYLLSVPDLIDLIELFTGVQNETFPLRWKDKDKSILRLEWSALFLSKSKTGRVRKSATTETWDDRAMRATKVKEKLFVWKGTQFERYCEAAPSVAT